MTAPDLPSPPGSTPKGSPGQGGAPGGPIRVGVSSCLLGQEVRYDGGHKRDPYVAGTLSRCFELVPVCPEVAVGLGTPREPIRLVRMGEQVRVRGVRTPGLDVTERLRRCGETMAGRLPELSGYIFKGGSPSCGMEGVQIGSEGGLPVGTGRGAYAEAFMAANPLLPCEEEGRLGDPLVRESFLVRVFVYHRWQRLVAEGLTPGALVAFHTDHKYLLLAHDEAAYRRLGRQVAQAGTRPLERLGAEYARELMGALARRATPGQHANVLQHLLGYVSGRLDAGERAETMDLIERYRQGLVPLVAPISRLRRHFLRHPHPFVNRQHYLDPQPYALMLSTPG